MYILIFIALEVAVIYAYEQYKANEALELPSFA